MGGVCTYQFARYCGIVCAANQQNLDGTYEMAWNFNHSDVQQMPYGRSLDLLMFLPELKIGPK